MPVHRPSELTLSVANRTDQLGAMIDAAEVFLSGWNVEPSDKQQVLIILDEVASNVVKCAWPDGTPHVFQISLRIEPAAPLLHLAIEVVDDGRAFDPTTVPAPDLDAELDARKPGGLGLFMMREMSDGIDYSRIAGRNHLRVFKRLQPAAGG